MDLDAIARAIQVERGCLETSPRARVGPSPIHGRGLFAEAPIGQGAVLVALDGQRVSLADAPGVLFALEWNALSRTALLVREIRTSYGFINHSRAPSVRIDADRMVLVAACAGAPGAELLLDYLDQPLPAAYLAHPSAEFLRP
jgi:hypothetical protein